MKYYKVVVNSHETAYFKLENNIPYKWVYHWWEIPQNARARWLKTNPRVIKKMNTSPNYHEILPKLYSCDNCQNKGVVGHEEPTLVPCPCLQNPFSIANKLS